MGPKLCKGAAIASRWPSSEHMGGSCVNFGCYPSKAVHASARVAAPGPPRRKDFGVAVGDVRPDLAGGAGLRARAKVEDGRAAHHRRVSTTAACKLFAAHARLAGRTDDGEGFRVSTRCRRTDQLASPPASSSSTPAVADAPAGRARPRRDSDPITAENWTDAGPPTASTAHAWRRVHRHGNGPVLPPHGHRRRRSSRAARQPLAQGGRRTSPATLQELPGRPRAFELPHRHANS